MLVVEKGVLSVKKYEMILILKPNLQSEVYPKFIKTFEEWVSKNGGEILQSNDIGLRDLGTEFDKNTRGYYIGWHYTAGNQVLDEIKKRLAVNEDVIRYLNVIVTSDEHKLSIREGEFEKKR